MPYLQAFSFYAFWFRATHRHGICLFRCAIQSRVRPSHLTNGGIVGIVAPLRYNRFVKIRGQFFFFFFLNFIVNVKNGPYLLTPQTALLV